MARLLSKRIVEADEDKIRIKYANGDIVKVHNIENVDKIVLRNPFEFPNAKWFSIWQEIKGYPMENAIEVLEGNEIYAYHFVPESHFMIEQLKKLKTIWENKGVGMELIEDDKNTDPEKVES